MSTNRQKLEELAAQKEQELQNIRLKQFQGLETALRVSQADLMREKEKLHQLQGDFKYNLELIEQRDQELERYEEMFGELKKVFPVVCLIQIFLGNMRGKYVFLYVHGYTGDGYMASK